MTGYDPCDTTQLVLDPAAGEAIVTTTPVPGGRADTVVFLPGFWGTCEAKTISGRDSMDVVCELFPGSIGMQLVGRGYRCEHLPDLAEAVGNTTGMELSELVADARPHFPLPAGVPRIKDAWLRRDGRATAEELGRTLLAPSDVAENRGARVQHSAKDPSAPLLTPSRHCPCNTRPHRRLP